MRGLKSGRSLAQRIIESEYVKHYIEDLIRVTKVCHKRARLTVTFDTVFASDDETIIVGIQPTFITFPETGQTTPTEGNPEPGALSEDEMPFDAADFENEANGFDPTPGFLTKPPLKPKDSR